ncbi:MAG: ABC transporter ATP-binding protein [Alphaproteobacteria bacterium]
MAETLLEVSQLEVVYNNVIRAVQGISLDVPAGSTVALIGLNGAGKTTTLRAISGFLPSERATIREGTIQYDGKSILGLSPDDVVRRGIGLVPERNKVFSSLTVDENLNIGALRARKSKDPNLNRENVLDHFPSLAKHRSSQAVFLSGGERQLLAIAMALLGKPRLLIVDELSLGLSPSVRSLVTQKLLELKAELGLSLLLVDQDVSAILEIADHGYVVENGIVVREGTASELLAHGDVQEFYMGKGETEDRMSYRDVKQYKRTRRWWG